MIEKFEIQTPETRIIFDEEFYQVDKTFAERMYNRNQGIRRPTMIKDLLGCGECGSHFCAVLKSLGRAYECAAKAGRIKVKCLLGPCVLMSKLDGLVLRLCIQKFAQYDLVKKSELKNDDLFAEKKYGCWLVNNDSHRFVFDRESRMFSEIRSGRVLGKYTFEEFNQLTQERGMVGEFSPYEFNIDKQYNKTALGMRSESHSGAILSPKSLWAR